jgi:hypothetical protein
VRAFLEEVPQAKEELKFDWAMASRWKESLERPKPKVEKPVLNTDDLDDMF